MSLFKFLLHCKSLLTTEVLFFNQDKTRNILFGFFFKVSILNNKKLKQIFFSFPFLVENLFFRKKNCNFCLVTRAQLSYMFYHNVFFFSPRPCATTHHVSSFWIFFSIWVLIHTKSQSQSPKCYKIPKFMIC